MIYLPLQDNITTSWPVPERFPVLSIFCTTLTTLSDQCTDKAEWWETGLVSSNNETMVTAFLSNIYSNFSFSVSRCWSKCLYTDNMHIMTVLRFLQSSCKSFCFGMRLIQSAYQPLYSCHNDDSYLSSARWSSGYSNKALLLSSQTYQDLSTQQAAFHPPLVEFSHGNSSLS